MSYVKSFQVKGRLINKGEPYERIIKIIASPNTKKMSAQRFTFGMSIIPAGGKTEPADTHSHEGIEECVYVVTGKGEAKVGGQIFQIEPETFIMIRPNEPHQFLNNSDETMKLVWVSVPPGAEKSLIAEPT